MDHPVYRRACVYSWLVGIIYFNKYYYNMTCADDGFSLLFHAFIILYDCVCTYVRRIIVVQCNRCGASINVGMYRHTIRLIYFFYAGEIKHLWFILCSYKLSRWLWAPSGLPAEYPSTNIDLVIHENYKNQFYKLCKIL